MTKIAFRGEKAYRPWYVLRFALNLMNHRIARRNLQVFPQVAILSFDNIGVTINLEGRYENDLLEALGRFLVEHLQVDRDSIALDIGANIGNHALFFSTIFRKVYAFEPNPRIFSLLQFNSAGSDIVPLNYGLSCESGVLPFALNPTNLGASRVVRDDAVGHASRAELTDIQVRRLDDEAQFRNQNIAFIKIDVEGHELQVLNGASQLIAATRPVIVFEQEAASIVAGTSDVIEYLRAMNYRFFTIQSNFNLGRAIVARLTAILLRTIFGFRKDFVPTVHFETKFYEMIVAVPD